MDWIPKDEWQRLKQQRRSVKLLKTISRMSWPQRRQLAKLLGIDSGPIA